MKRRGGLRTAPDELGSQPPSLDQPTVGSDQLFKRRLDQAQVASDRRARLDQSSQEGDDRLAPSLDQARSASDRQGPEPEQYDDGSEDSESSLEYHSSLEDRGSRSPVRGTDVEEDRTPSGSLPVPHEWQTVTRKGRSHDERSEGSEDVETLLDNPGSEDSKYFGKRFNESQDGDEPRSDGVESDNGTRPTRPETKERTRQARGSKQARREVKDPARPRGFEDQLPSIGRIWRGNSRDTAAGVDAPALVTVRPDKQNVPSGVHFNSAEGSKKKKSDHSRSRRSRRNRKSGNSEKGTEGVNETEGKRTTEGIDDLELHMSPSSSISSDPTGTPQPKARRARRPRSPSITSSSSSPSPSPSSTMSSSTEDASSHSLPSSSYESDSSSYSSSSDSSDGRRKKTKKEKRRANEKKREEARILKRVKIDPPSVWQGMSDLDVFDRWVWEGENLGSTQPVVR